MPHLLVTADQVIERKRAFDLLWMLSQTLAKFQNQESAHC
jgi:hypothetical protein